MGLDISAYRRLVEVTCTDKPECDHVTIYQDYEFAGREAPLVKGACYVSDDGSVALNPHVGFREILHDALTIAEHVAIKELRRLLNQNESRLMGEVVRDLMCAAIAKRDMAMDSSAPKFREVL